MEVKSNKFLTFELRNEDYAIPILKIKEIIGMMAITHVPKLPEFMKGVINLRGKIIPIIDLRLKFGLSARDYDERTSIIVMELATENGTKTSGIVVDTVQEVIDINREDVEPPPQYGTEIAFLTGIGKIGEQVIMLLDVDKILSSGELKTLESIDTNK